MVSKLRRGESKFPAHGDICDRTGSGLPEGDDKQGQGNRISRRGRYTPPAAPLVLKDHGTAHIVRVDNRRPAALLTLTFRLPGHPTSLVCSSVLPTLLSFCATSMRNLANLECKVPRRLESKRRPSTGSPSGPSTVEQNALPSSPWRVELSLWHVEGMPPATLYVQGAAERRRGGPLYRQ